MRFRFRWLSWDFVDPKWGLSKEDHLAVSMRAMQVLRLRQRQWPLLLLLGIVGIGWAALLLYVQIGPVGGAVALLGAMLLWWLIGVPVMRRRLMPCIYQSLRVLGHEICSDCGKRLARLDDAFECCPSCNTPRSIISCYRCGYLLTGLDAAHTTCPECDTNQREVPSAGKERRRSIVPLFRLSPDSVRRQINRRVALDGTLRNVLLLALIVSITTLLIVLYYDIQTQLTQLTPMSTMAAVFPYFGVLFLACVFFLTTNLMRRTYEAFMRKHVRLLGYELCLKCGATLHNIDQRLIDCPRCGRARTPPPSTALAGRDLPQPTEFGALSRAYHQSIWRAVETAATSLPKQRVQWLWTGGIAVVVIWCAFVWPSMPQLVQWMIAASFLLFLCVAIYFMLSRFHRQLRHFGWRALREAGHDVCPQCGVWQRDDMEQTPCCPDCKWQRESLPAANADSDSPSG